MAEDSDRVPVVQWVWLSLYWIALAFNSLLLIEALLSAAEVALASLVALALAVISTLIGAVFATRILRAGVTSTSFIKNTTTIRVIAIAWILIEVAIVSGAVISVLASLDLEVVNWTGGFVGTVGSISILAVLGPGYSEYREALATAKQPVT